jgi:hypothetical protein
LRGFRKSHLEKRAGWSPDALQCLRAVAGEAGEDAGTEGRRRGWMWEVKGVGDIIVKDGSVSQSIDEWAGTGWIHKDRRGFGTPKSLPRRSMVHRIAHKICMVGRVHIQGTLRASFTAFSDEGNKVIRGNIEHFVDIVDA